MEPDICRECGEKMFESIINLTEEQEKIPYCSLECLLKNRKVLPCIECNKEIGKDGKTMKTTFENGNICFMDICSQKCGEECRKRFTRPE